MCAAPAGAVEVAVGRSLRKLRRADLVHDELACQGALLWERCARPQARWVVERGPRVGRPHRLPANARSEGTGCLRTTVLPTAVMQVEQFRAGAPEGLTPADVPGVRQWRLNVGQPEEAHGSARPRPKGSGPRNIVGSSAAVRGRSVWPTATSLQRKEAAVPPLLFENYSGPWDWVSRGADRCDSAPA